MRFQSTTTRNRSVRRTARSHEHGLTLTEMLVTLAIMTIIGGSIPAAMSIGIRTLGDNGTSGHLASSHDVLALQQQVSTDVNRSACLVNGDPTQPPIGTCGNSLPTAGSCTGLLCVAWLDATDKTCHVTTYASTTNALNNEVGITRTESVVTSTSPLTLKSVGQHNVTRLGDGTSLPTHAALLPVDPEEVQVQGKLTWDNVLVSMTVTRRNDSATLTMRPFVDNPSLAKSASC
jgi:prepilin-type N-terminal cleavage/methylation domain-containing protein